MKFFPENTLAFFNAAPQFHRVPVAHLETRVLGAATKKFRATCTLQSPDESAVMFYALNHCASIVRKKFTPNEPLPAWAVDAMKEYTGFLATEGNRLLHYMISICTKECRHIKGMDHSWWEGLGAKFGKDVQDFIQTKVEPTSEEQAVDNYMKTSSKFPIGNYTKALAYCFYKGKWQTNYGGKAWGKIADTVDSFIQGTTSLEMMVDTGFTLAHNTAPIFNKGMMYAQNSHLFIALLDVQRSGQIPEMLLDPVEYGMVKPASARTVCESVKKNVEDAFGAYLDWGKVEALGAVGKYDAYKQKQQKQYGATPTTQVKGGQKVQVVGEWTVFPGQSVTKFKRVSA